MRGSLLLAVALSVGLASGCGSRRPIEDWELSSGYDGWVVFEFANPRCPPATLTFTSLVLEVDSSGRGCTSTALPKWPMYLHFKQADSQGAGRTLGMGEPGNGGEVWQYSVGEASQETPLTGDGAGETSQILQAAEFFVGTEAEFKTSQPRPNWGRMRASVGN
jgi:hypothetical protein